MPLLGRHPFLLIPHFDLRPPLGAARFATLCVCGTALFPLASLVALRGRRSSQAARDDLPASEPDELDVGGEIALPQLSGLHQEPPEPLQPQRLRPTRSTPDEAGQHVEAAAHAHDDGDLEALPVALAPGLLEGEGIPT